MNLGEGRESDRVIGRVLKGVDGPRHASLPLLYSWGILYVRC